MKKILYIHHGTSEGGAPRSLAFLIEKLDKNKYMPIVLCIKDRKNIKFFEDVGAKVIFDNSLHPFHGSVVSGMSAKIFARNIVYALPTFKKVQKYFKEIKPDIVHLNSSCLFLHAFASKVVNNECKVICHIREPLLNNFAGEILRYFNNKYVDGFISIDHFDLENMRIVNAKSKVVYNFVNTEIYNSQVDSQCLRTELRISKDDVIFLILGRIIESNGVYELVKMCKKYMGSNKNFKFVFVGDKIEDKSKYIKKVRRLVKDTENCYIVPFRKDVPQVIASSDVLICPFTKPHFARSIIEAGAMGKPTIGSNIGGVNELIINHETGILFDNEEELTNAILSLGQDKQLRKSISSKAEKYALNNFSSTINSKRIVEFYNKV